MKAMKPEDRPKAIGLGVGVVVIFTLVTLRVKSAMGGADVPQPAQSSVTLSGSTGGTSPAPAPSGGGSTEIIGTLPPKGGDSGGDKPIIIQPTKGSQNNPFRTFQGTGDKPANVENPDIKQSVRPIVPVTNFQPTDGALPPVNGKRPVDPQTGQIGLDVEKDVAAQEMQVTGVLTGKKPVAVIRLSGKDYVVTAGETFANGLKLITATPREVVISQGLLTRTLKMGIPLF